MELDPADIQQFGQTYQAFMEAMSKVSSGGALELTGLGERVRAFLQADLDTIDPITHYFPPHHAVDLDVALSAMLERYESVLTGVSGTHKLAVDSFNELLTRSHFGNFIPGPVSYQRQATGPDEERRVVTLGIGLIMVATTPLVYLHRSAERRYGREQVSLDIICGDATIADEFVDQLRALMAKHSLLRGKIISFAGNDFDYHDPGAGMTFLERPSVSADDVVLPDGVLDRITRHVIGIGERRDLLQAAKQHLKRGVLLYGPPGTGKTHIIRHLLSISEGTTAVLLSGRTLGMINTAAQLAKTIQPAIIVLEDCDLVAEHRGGTSNAALFETLEAMDGLTTDGDVTFILTTNRVDLLEQALVERPGRVDLAVEIAKPDRAGRVRLLNLYAAELIKDGLLSPDVIDATADRTEGVTASFSKELIRRCVLNAAQRGERPGDADLVKAVDEMHSDSERLTRILLGAQDDRDSAPPFDALDSGDASGPGLRFRT